MGDDILILGRTWIRQAQDPWRVAEELEGPELKDPAAGEVRHMMIMVFLHMGTNFFVTCK